MTMDTEEFDQFILGAVDRILTDAATFHSEGEIDRIPAALEAVAALWEVTPPTGFGQEAIDHESDTFLELAAAHLESRIRVGKA